MIAWSGKMTLLAGIGLILITNTVALLGVAYNRSGEPDSVLQLSERELQLPYEWRGNRENSGVGLTLRWRVLLDDSRDPTGVVTSYSGIGGSPKWLDQAKLSALGFDLGQSADTEKNRARYDKALAKEVLLVLEFDGPAYRSTLERLTQYAASQEALYAANANNKEFEQRAKNARAQASREERENSRLLAIDVGLDEAALRAKYPDRGRYAIVRGQVRPQFVCDAEEHRLAGYISAVNIDRINVPLRFHPLFESSINRDRNDLQTPVPNYAVAVAFGRRLEPWITAASRH
jgi:hypothetical protein